MPPRFYVPEARAGQTTIALPQDEAAHLTRVLRLKPGDPIRIFNGRGEEWDACVDSAGKHGVVVRLLGSTAAAPEPRIRIVLAVAVLKGDKMDDIVRDAVMLGAAGIIPLLTTRTEVSATALERSQRIARWQRIAVSSAKQCGRAVVPPVHGAATLEHALRQARHPVMLVEPSAGAEVKRLRDLDGEGRADEPLTLFVGPEGGWSEQEVQCARTSAAMLLTLGAQTLRADAVPVVALTAIRVQMEDF